MESRQMGGGGEWAARRKLYYLLELFKVVMSPRRVTRQAWEFKEMSR